MENETYVIIVFYSGVYLLVCFALLLQELDLQYRRMIRYAFS